VRDVFIPLFAALGRSSIGMAIRSSATLIAVTQIVHLIGLALFLGALLMVDMTLLGVGFRRHPASRVARELAPWSTAGLIVMLVSGPFILSSESLKCFDASFFWIKMTTLGIALVFHLAVHRPVAQAEPPVRRWRAKLVAGLSLALWVGVAISGKMIGIYGDDLRKEPAPFQVRISLVPPTTALRPVRSAEGPGLRAMSRVASLTTR
jgi:hypothetical protein